MVPFTGTSYIRKKKNAESVRIPCLSDFYFDLLPNQRDFVVYYILNIFVYFACVFIFLLTSRSIDCVLFIIGPVNRSHSLLTGVA